MKYLLLIICLFFLVPANVWADTGVPNFKLNDTGAEFGIDEEFSLDLSVDTKGESINGIESVIEIPNAFELVEINENDSIIPLWIKRPVFENGEIKLAGIIPGGFNGVINPGSPMTTGGKIISIILRPKTPGVSKIIFSHQIITLHDGSGTQIKNEDIVRQFNILDIHRTKTLETLDVTSPDLFYPKLVRDPNIFNGDLTLFFETRDFESGIDRYEVREDDGEFVTATSPYRLRGQGGVGIITVRAIDRAGNDRTIELKTGFSKTPKLLWPFVLVLVALLILLVFLYRTKRSR